MPNSVNFAWSYSTFLMVLLVCYPFAWFQLYASLWRTRLSKLRQVSVLHASSPFAGLSAMPGAPRLCKPAGRASAALDLAGLPALALDGLPLSFCVNNMSEVREECAQASRPIWLQSNCAGISAASVGTELDQAPHHH